MITMTEKQTIIHLYRVDNYSIRKIAQTMGRSRNTIRRVIREYLGVVSSPTPSATLDDFLAKKPSYRRSGRRPWVMTPEVCEAIDRITHKAFLINMTGISYRLKETEKINSAFKELINSY